MDYEELTQESARTVGAGALLDCAQAGLSEEPQIALTELYQRAKKLESVEKELETLKSAVIASVIVTRNKTCFFGLILRRLRKQEPITASEALGLVDACKDLEKQADILVDLIGDKK